jgi:hypothetical protein
MIVKCHSADRLLSASSSLNCTNLESEFSFLLCLRDRAPISETLTLFAFGRVYDMTSEWNSANLSFLHRTPITSSILVHDSQEEEEEDPRLPYFEI